MSKHRFDEMVLQLRNRWPQAHIELGSNTGDPALCVVPGINLPRGWFIMENGKNVAATICTILFELRAYPSHVLPLNGFAVDLPDMRLAGGAHPHYARLFCAGSRDNPYAEYIRGHEQWRDLTRFWWRAQFYDPNRDTLYTCVSVARERLSLIK